MVFWLLVLSNQTIWKIGEKVPTILLLSQWHQQPTADFKRTISALIRSIWDSTFVIYYCNWRWVRKIYLVLELVPVSEVIAWHPDGWSCFATVDLSHSWWLIPCFFVTVTLLNNYSKNKFDCLKFLYNTMAIVGGHCSGPRLTAFWNWVTLEGQDWLTLAEANMNIVVGTILRRALEF